MRLILLFHGVLPPCILQAVYRKTKLGRQRAQLKEQKKQELLVFAKENPEDVTDIFKESSALTSMSNNLDVHDLQSTFVPDMPWLWKPTAPSFHKSHIQKYNVLSAHALDSPLIPL